MKTGRNACPGAVARVSSRWPGVGDEALRGVLYRAIFGALLCLNFCQCEN